MESGYSKADSGNLPPIDAEMITYFVSQNEDFISAEVRGVKSTRAARASYGDAAIGYVQVKRDDSVCTVRGRVTPEHKVRAKGYSCTVVVDEIEEKIISTQCHDCAASSGGCKHGIAFLFWIHRRSEEPSPTEVECYWRKSKLSKVGTSIKFVTAADLRGKEVPDLPETSGLFLQTVIETGIATESRGALLKYFSDSPRVTKLSLHHLSLDFMKTTDNHGDPTKFVNYCALNMDPGICAEAADKSKLQSESSLWFDLRYCRITASKILEAARCRTMDGVLTETIIGASKIPDTDPMKRGRKLESQVLEVVKTHFKINLQKTGIFLNSKYPAIGASPDAISTDYCIEVKCPSKEKSVSYYIDNNKKLKEKCYAQLQIQMHMCDKKEGLFCVASPDFENTQEVTIIEINHDEEYCESLIEEAMVFWKKAIFPILISK